MIRSCFSGVSRVPLRLLAGTLALAALHTAGAQPVLSVDSDREQSLTQQIENNPKSADAYNTRANLYLNSGQFDKVLADCTQAIRLDPQFAWAYNNRGIAHVGKRDFDRALADYDRASELDPTYTFPYNNRAVIWHELGLYRKAIAECNRALELDPDYVDPLVHRGEAYARLGRLRQAVADLTLAFCLDPQYGPQSKERIDTDPQRKYVEGTVAEWTAEIREDPDNAQAYVKRAFSYLDEFQLREAVADLRKADRLRSATAQARRFRSSTSGGK
jgi:Tfp pilus assembly protein PilF